MSENTILFSCLWTARSEDYVWKNKSDFDRCVDIVPDCFWGWVTWAQIDRQTKGRMRVIVMVCQCDSVGLLSFSPRVLAEGLGHHNRFWLHNQIKFNSFNLFCTSGLITCPCLQFKLYVCLISLLLQLVIHHSFLFTQHGAMSDKQRQPTESWCVIKKATLFF